MRHSGRRATPYLEEWNYRPALSGTPQGGIISPILSNVYLSKLDKFVEETLIPKYTRGTTKKRNPEYVRITHAIEKAEKENADREILRALRRRRNQIACTTPFDPGYRRLRYIRYADDFLLGFDGPKDEAEEIKARIDEFLRDQLKLEMSPEKTLITHAGTEKARFLGYDIVAGTPSRGRSRGRIHLLMPPQKREDKIARYTREGKAVRRSELLNNSD